MDNAKFDMTSESANTLASLFEIVFGTHRHAVGYAIRPAVPGARWEAEKYLIDPKNKNLLEWYREPKDARLVFFWTERKGQVDFVAFPFKMNAEGCADFAARWLAEADYGKQPDHDGDNKKGWRAYNEAWGHVDGDWGAFLAVSPRWAMYGK